MTRDQKIEHFLELAHRAGCHAYGKYKFALRMEMEDYRSLATIFLIQAIDLKREWGIDAPGLFYKFILNRLSDHVRINRPGKRTQASGRITFCSDKALYFCPVPPSQEAVAEVGLLVARRANERQRDIVRLMLTGLNGEEVSRELHISQSLVSRKLRALSA